MRKSKYGNKKVIIDGIKFDSKKEGQRYLALLQLAKDGKISKLTLQPKFVLMAGFRHEGKAVRAINYVSDFQYVKDGEVIVEDVKGMLTEVYKIKKKLFLSQYADKYTFVES